MSKLPNRTTIIALWVSAVLGLFVLFGSSLPAATGWLLLFAAFVPPTILFILSRAPSPTLSEVIAAELRPVDKPDRR